jgi:hypothetical protein
LSYITASTKGGGEAHINQAQRRVTSKKHLRGTDSSGPEMLLYHAEFPRMCVAGTGHLLSDQWSIFEIFTTEKELECHVLFL